MESQRIQLFLIVCVGLLNFGVSSDQFEKIKDCNYGRPNSNVDRVNPSVVTITCGEVDNTSKIFQPSVGVFCSNIGGLSVPSYSLIREIYFENCLFHDINNDHFRDFIQLEEFDISNVNLTTITIKQLPQSPLLTRFNASHNQLTKIPSNLFGSYKNLQILDVSYNAINKIESTDLKDAGELIAANFSANKIKRVQHDAFNNAMNLTSLDLSGNRLKSLEDHLFDNLINLQYLNLAYNPLKELKISTLAYQSKLEHLDLKGIGLLTIELGTFSFQKKLISLDLSENKFKWINFGMFLPGLKHLQSLRLAGNQLTDIHRFENELLPRLSSLDIRNNQFKCEHLQDVMTSVNWTGIELPMDPRAIDLQKPNVGGINCIKESATDLGASNEEYEDEDDESDESN